MLPLASRHFCMSLCLLADAHDMPARPVVPIDAAAVAVVVSLGDEVEPANRDQRRADGLPHIRVRRQGDAGGVRGPPEGQAQIQVREDGSDSSNTKLLVPFSQLGPGFSAACFLPED